MRVDRQVDHGRGALDDRHPVLVVRLLLLDRFGEEAGVQVEPHRGHVAALLGAEDVAGAADLEVG